MNILTQLNVIFVGALLFAAIQYAWMWWHDWRARTPLLFAILCVLSAGLGCAVVGLYAAQTAAKAQFWLDQRTIWGCALVQVVAWLAAEIAGIRARGLLWSVTAVMSATIVLTAAGLPVNGTVVGMSELTMPWGETLHVPIRGPPGWWLLPIYLTIVVSYAFTIWCGSVLRRRDLVAGLLLIGIGLFTVLATVNGLLVDMLHLPLPYFGSVSSFAWMVMMMVLVSREYHRRGERVVASERRLMAIFMATEDATLVVHRDGRPITSNPAASRLVGCRKSADGRPCPCCEACTLGRPMTLLAGSHAAAGGGTLRVDTTIQHDQGAMIPVEAMVQSITYDDQPALLVTLHDQRERLRIEHERKRMEQLSTLGLLAGGIAHDVRNSISCMTGVAELLHLHTNDPGQVLKYAGLLAQAGDQANQLCEDLLRFARKGADSAQDYDVHAAVRTAAAVFGTTGRKVTVDVSRLGSARHHTHGDRNLLQTAILNLCLNARDAMTGDGVITIASAERAISSDDAIAHAGYPLSAGPHLRLTVSDTGHGMDAATLRRCLEPLFTTKGDLGTGLGLSSVVRAATEHRGSLEVVSAPGQGTQVTLLLPISDPSPSREPPRPG